MDTWRQIALPYICERLIALSVPERGEMLIVSYEGMHLVRLTDPVRVETDETLAEYAAYDPKIGVARFRGRAYRMIGLCRGEPRLQSEAGERLVLDEREEVLHIWRGGVEVFRIGYKNVSGDWAVATFSDDDQFVVVGCPYGLDVVVLRRNEGGER